MVLTDLAEAHDVIARHICWQDCNRLTGDTGECVNCVLKAAVERLGKAIDALLAERGCECEGR